MSLHVASDCKPSGTVRLCIHHPRQGCRPLRALPLASHSIWKFPPSLPPLLCRPVRTPSSGGRQGCWSPESGSHNRDDSEFKVDVVTESLTRSSCGASDLDDSLSCLPGGGVSRRMVGRRKRGEGKLLDGWEDSWSHLGPSVRRGATLSGCFKRRGAPAAMCANFAYQI